MAAPRGGLQKAVEAQTDPIAKAMSPKPRPNKKANVALEMLMQSSTYILARLDLHLLMEKAEQFWRDWTDASYPIELSKNGLARHL